MAGFFAKFARGAASAGATLYADQAMQELRADILSKRDKVLQTNKLELEKERRIYQEGLAEKERSRKADTLTESREYEEGLAKDERSRQSTALTESREYKEKQLGGKQAFDMEKIKKQMTNKLSKGVNLTMQDIRLVTDTSMSEQESKGIYEGDKGYVNYEDKLSTVARLLKKLTGRKIQDITIIWDDIFGPDESKYALNEKGAMFLPEEIEKISPKSDEKIVPRPDEKVYINHTTGERKIKRDGKWLTIQ